MKKGQVLAVCVALLCIGNEVVSLAVLSVLVFIGVAALFNAIAEVGNW